MAKNVTCLPEPDEFSSCEDLMTNSVLRVCVWVLGILAFSANLLVIIWRTKFKNSTKVSFNLFIDIINQHKLI